MNEQNGNNLTSLRMWMYDALSDKVMAAWNGEYIYFIMMNTKSLCWQDQIVQSQSMNSSVTILFGTQFMYRNAAIAHK